MRTQETVPTHLRQRRADPALTVLAVELAMAVFLIAPLGVVAPRSRWC
jgi:hypothetical protein